MACVVLFGACGYTTPQGLGSDAEPAKEPDAPPDADNIPVVGCPASYDVDLTAAGFSKYRVSSTALEWREAQDACVADGIGFTGKTHLVVFGSDAERLATEPLGLARNTWIGLSDRATEGAFVWVTVEADPPQAGAPMWAGANPDGGDDNDCIRISMGWQYDDKACDTVEPSICECDANAADPARY